MIEKIREDLNLYRRYFNWKKAGCIYVHIPKAAGTSINHSLYGRTLGHYSAATIKNKFPELFQKSFTFSLTRNPWDRLLSAYKFVYFGGTEDMKIKNSSQYCVKEFDSFEKFVFEWLYYRNPYDLDYVFQPQHKFIFDSNDELLLDWLGCVEEIDNTLSKLEKVTGRSIKLDTKNSSGNKMRYQDFYTSQAMIDLVSEKYKKDIETLNYSFN